MSKPSNSSIFHEAIRARDLMKKNRDAGLARFRELLDAAPGDGMVNHRLGEAHLHLYQAGNNPEDRREAARNFEIARADFKEKISRFKKARDFVDEAEGYLRRLSNNNFSAGRSPETSPKPGDVFREAIRARDLMKKNRDAGLAKFRELLAAAPGDGMVNHRLGEALLHLYQAESDPEDRQEAARNFEIARADFKEKERNGWKARNFVDEAEGYLRELGEELSTEARAPGGAAAAGDSPPAGRPLSREAALMVKAASQELERQSDIRNRQGYFMFGLLEQELAGHPDLGECTRAVFKHYHHRLPRDMEYTGPERASDGFDLKVGEKYLKGEVKLTPEGNAEVIFPTEGFPPGKLDEILSNGIYYIPDFRDGLRNLIRFLETAPRESRFLRHFISRIEPVTGNPPQGLPESAAGLQPAQRLAAEKALGQDITFIWGPPGTGKTRTLATIAGILYERGKRVLVSALSTAAVDEVFRKVLEIESTDPDADARDFVRLGSRKKAPPGPMSQFLQPRFPPRGRTVTFATVFQILNREPAQICGAFDYVVMDEVSMTPIPSLAAISYCAREAIVLAGDPCQLPPPYPENPDSPNEWYAQNIFDKVGIGMENDARGVFLDTQYRMIRQISVLVSELFYQGRLKCGHSEPPLCYHETEDGAGHPVPPLVFIDSSGAVAKSGDFSDQDYRRNETHARAIAGLAERLVSGRVAEAPEIGIIAPYNAQVATIRKCLSPRLQEEIKLGTVHSFQGQERKVVIFDITDDNIAPSPLTMNRKLLNVALSRARQLVCIIGNKEYLTGGHFDGETRALFSRIITEGERWRRRKTPGSDPDSASATFPMPGDK